MSTDQDVLQHGHALIEADVLEGSSESSLHHVIRSRGARDSEAFDEAHVPEWAHDGEQQHRDKSEQRQHHGEHSFVEACQPTNHEEEVQGETDERDEWRKEECGFAARAGWRRDEALPIDLNVTFRRRINASNDVKEGGLPRAIRANDGSDHPAWDFKVNLAHRHEPAESTGDRRRL